jgi:anionic cell wall polymer biosynthesis LytR-Cps2A-Psr (LCP) family protein
MTVLALGIDGSFDYRYGISDVIRVVRVDFVTPKVTVLSLPRDLWVEIPEIENSYNITHGKLNQAYFYGTPGMGYKGPGRAQDQRTLDLNFGRAPITTGSKHADFRQSCRCSRRHRHLPAQRC